MKLIASVFCVAALSLVGCADQETTGGGHLGGMLPEKAFTYQPGNLPLSENPEVRDEMNTLVPTLGDVNPEGFYGQLFGGMNVKTELAPEVCENCKVTAIKIGTNSFAITDVHVYSDGEREICRLYLTDDNVFVNECLD